MAVFVGRGPELETLVTALDEALSGRGGLALLAGEPGIGKTTLAARVASIATERGADVHWGRCVELEGAPVYWPWRQLIRDWADARPPEAVAIAIGRGAKDVARVVPEVGEVLGLRPDDRAEEDEDARFRLFDSISRWLRRATADRPLVAVLEDLHWADVASLRLLEFVAAAVPDSRALIITTYRDADAAPGTPLAHALGALRRGPATRHVSLAGLSADEITALAGEEHHRSLEPATAAAVRAHTAGNPFFVSEVLRLLAAEDRLDGADPIPSHVPPGVRAVILRRIAHLGSEADDVLGLAAVLGARFDADVLARMAGGRADVVEKVLAGAVRLALLVEDDSGHHRFVHALVRDALYEQIPRRQRADLHRAAAEVLEARAGGDPDTWPTLAAHFLAAAQTGVADKAVEYAAKAAEQAASRLAHEQAIALYEAALRLSVANDSRRADLLVALGRARFYSDDASGSRAELLAAAEIAQALGDPYRMAQALLAIGSGRFRGAPQWDVPVPLLEADLALLGDRDPALRAQLVSRMSDMVEDRAEALRLADAAVALAREDGDPDTLVFALGRRFLAFQYEDPIDVRRGHIDELMAAAARCEDRQRAYDARAMRMRLLLECGELDEATAEAAALDDEADAGRGSLLLRLGEPVATMVASVRGAYADAQQTLMGLAARAAERGRAGAVHGVVQVQMLPLLRDQGALEAVRSGLDQLRQDLEDDSAVYLDAVVLLIDAELGRVEEATALLHDKVGPDLAGWVYGWGGTDMVELAWIAEACALIGDGAYADRLYELLKPAADRLVIASMPPVVTSGWGTMALGIAAALRGRYDEAEAHFVDALARHEEMGAAPLVARTKFHWAQAVAARGDMDRARPLATAARGLASKLGMAPLVKHVDGLLDRLGKGPEPVGATRNGTPTFVFTDIVGSTERTIDAGDVKWLETIRQHNVGIRALVERHDGREVKALGDGFMLVFDSARRAIECAAAIQTEMGGGPVAIRIGVHSGEALQEEGDYYGHHVNLAARVADAAAPGEVLVSDLVHQLARSAGDLAFGRARDVVLKGVQGTTRLHPLLAVGDVTLTDPENGSAVAGDAAVFRREGEFWTVSFGGATARLKDTKGMRHLAELLAHPGEERHVLDLVVTAEGHRGRTDVGDAGAILDPEAKAAYRQRVRDLTEERDEAVAFNDLARAERAEAEIDALIAELGEAVGLGGRDRRAADASERARVSVSRAVKSAVERISAAIPVLGTHFRATIRTGTYCSYTPDPRLPASWEL